MATPLITEPRHTNPLDVRALFHSVSAAFAPTISTWRSFAHEVDLGHDVPVLAGGSFVIVSAEDRPTSV